MHRAAEQVVEDAEAQRAADRVDARDVELGERGRHDREPAGEHRRALGLERREAQPLDVARADHPLAQPRQAFARDAGRRHAVLLEDFGERERGARRRVRGAPVLGAELARDRFDLGARRGVGRGEGRRRQRAVGEEAPRHADAADLQRFEPLRHETAADDELGRAAADVDDEPRLVGCRKHVRDAVVDEPRFLVAGDDVDREAERALRLRQERRGVLRHAERVGGDRAHGGRMQALDALAEAREARERGAPRLGREPALLVEPAPMRSVSRQVSSR